MVKRLAILVAAFSLTACGSSMAQSGTSTSAHGIAASCGPAGAHTLAAGSAVRVYVSAGKVYGCSAAGHRSFLLGNATRCLGSARVAPPVAVAGELAAYGVQRCGIDTGSTTVTVRRLSDGRVLRSFAATSVGLVESYQSIRSIAIRSSGAVAWIAVVSSIVGHRSATEVHKADSSGAPTMLDSGAAVVPNSLHVHGAKIIWKHGAATRTASLS